MRHLKYLVLLAILVLPAAYSHAQVSIGVQIGPSYGVYNAPPVCEWGFYPDYPFGCAPYGYWGPEWFVDGVFIGAGPWYHFYYTHPVYYRRYYVDRGFGYYGGHEHFRGGGRIYERERFRGDDWRGREFRGDGGHDRGVRHDEGFRNFNRGDGGRGFRDGGGRSFRGDGGRGEFRGNGNGGWRGGDARGGGSREFHGSNGGSRGGDFRGNAGSRGGERGNGGSRGNGVSRGNGDRDGGRDHGGHR